VSALRDARFRRLAAGQALSSFGDSALYLVLAIWVKDLTNSNGAAGAVFFALGAMSLLAPAGGVLVDRVRHRRRLLITAAYVLTDIPQTVSIACGAALISVIDFRTLLGVLAAVTLTCGVGLLVVLATDARISVRAPAPSVRRCPATSR
jgi:MFS family permease